ncbi:hypothetical protein [Aliivibrio kagoshimensis]|uniref:hypothetical protein n=1 Tax=Aliivibrio kagoshimensis TaxID=2910230 RepID=UPI003D0BC070
MEYADEYKYEVIHKQLLTDKSKVAEMVKNDPDYLVATNNIGQTALEYFATLDHKDNVILLGTLGGTVAPSALRDICTQGSLEMVELLLPFCDKSSIENCIDMLTTAEIDSDKYQKVAAVFKLQGYQLKAQKEPFNFEDAWLPSNSKIEW